jgi:imidazolonepropionase-like amidohydrolase
MRVVAHIFALEDAKQLLKSGVDCFAHGVRDKDVDAEYLTILKQHPKTWVGPNLPPRTLPVQEAAAEIEWLTDTFPPSQIKRMMDELAKRQAAPGAAGGGDAGQSELFKVQCRNLKKVHDAGMIIGLGTDANGDIGWGAHTELADMVYCGLTAAEAIVAGTRTSAQILKLNDLGTVAAGKSADFIVLDANPLDNILNTRKIGQVYQRGKTIDRAGLKKVFTTEAN